MSRHPEAFTTEDYILAELRKITALLEKQLTVMTVGQEEARVVNKLYTTALSASLPLQVI